MARLLEQAGGLVLGLGNPHRPRPDPGRVKGRRELVERRLERRGVSVDDGVENGALGDRGDDRGRDAVAVEHRRALRASSQEPDEGRERTALKGDPLVLLHP